MPSLNKLLLIDAQNDFSDTPDTAPALPVTGAHADLLRTAAFIRDAGALLTGIVATLDAHPFVAIERTTFWRDADGAEVPPFTPVTAADVLAGRFVPVHADRVDPVSGLPRVDRVVELLNRLESSGRFKLMVWPVHCVKATWGASLHPAIAEALNDWERQAASPVAKVDKGQYPLAEHYGVFEAETPLPEVPSTCFNEALAESLSADLTLVAGQAGSHCVPASYDQLVRWRGDGRGIVVLTDCMSPVGGFERAQADFFERATAAGSLLMTADEALRLLRSRA